MITCNRTLFVSSLLALSLSACSLATVCTIDEYQDGTECRGCEPNTHVNEARTGCEEDSKTACGSIDNDCTQIEHSQKAECREGACSLVSCDDGYHVSDNQCVPNKTCQKDEDCPKPANAQGVSCEDKKCVVTCDEDYILDSAIKCSDDGICSNTCSKATIA